MPAQVGAMAGIYGCGTQNTISALYPTANDYSRLQTFNQRLGFDKSRIFVAKRKTLHHESKTNRQQGNKGLC